MLDYTRVRLRSVDCCAGSVQLRILTHTVDKTKTKRDRVEVAALSFTTKEVRTKSNQ